MTAATNKEDRIAASTFHDVSILRSGHGGVSRGNSPNHKYVDLDYLNFGPKIHNSREFLPSLAFGYTPGQRSGKITPNDPKNA